MFPSSSQIQAELTPPGLAMIHLAASALSSPLKSTVRIKSTWITLASVRQTEGLHATTLRLVDELDYSLSEIIS